MTLTHDQATALAELVALLRADSGGQPWDPTGVLAALRDCYDRADPATISIAAIRASQRPTNRTPAVIALAGEHWPTTPGARPERAKECPVHAHSRPAWNCSPCRADFLVTGTWPEGTLHRDAPREGPEPDPRERAAGEPQDQLDIGGGDAA